MLRKCLPIKACAEPVKFDMPIHLTATWLIVSSTAAGYHLAVALKIIYRAGPWLVVLPGTGPVGNTIFQSN